MEDRKAIQEAFAVMSPHYEEVVDQELNTFWGWNYRRFIDALLERTPIEANSRVLDIATGTAAIPRKLLHKQFTPGHIVGLDITFEMLSNAHQQLGYSATAISLACGSALAMPFEADRFDIITCGLASHHIEVTGLLGEIRRVIRNGGSVTIADVSVWPFLRLPGVSAIISAATYLYFLNKGRARALSEAHAITNVRSSKEWLVLMAEFGFENIRVEQLPSKYRWIPAPFVLTARVNELR